ncbi:PadR family transcriptional regulator [Streptomyces griseoluteus]|uniref:PadR family transcriptional regulator n=1 Tax=Streptomyces griseoluteus TaxID=29306 RepID=UPI0033D6D70B
MSLSRLMVLGLLANHGPQHGHQIKLTATRTEVESWGGISVGALYRELRQMNTDGLVRTVSVTQVGNRPQRTVYEITDAGRDALRALQEKAICDLRLGPDSFAVALMFGRVQDAGEMARLLDRRRQRLREMAAGINAEREQHLAEGSITALDAALFRRQAMLLEAELSWHEEFDAVLVEQVSGSDDPTGQDPTGQDPTEEGHAYA